MRFAVFASTSMFFCLITGCGDDAPPGPDPSPVLSVGTLSEPTGLRADYSCLGTDVAPTAGPVVPFILNMSDYRINTPAPNVNIEIFLSNTIAPTCVAPDCVSGVTDAGGRLEMMAPSLAWFAIRNLPRAGATASESIVGSVGFNVPGPPTEPPTGMPTAIVSVASISQATLDLIPLAVGFPRTPGTAILAGAVRDCMKRFVYGATVRVFDADGNELVEGTSPGEPHTRYFNGEGFPNAMQPYTHVDGAFAVIELTPTEDRPVRIEVYGRLAAGEEPRLVSCEQAYLYADDVTLMQLRPLRADGPACSM